MQLVRAVTTATVAPVGAGLPVNVHQGTFWPSDDPIVKAYPSLFDTDLVPGLSYTVEPRRAAERPVEQATAAPGEKRTTRRTQAS